MADEIFLADRLCSKVVHLMHTTSVMLIHDYILVTPSAHATKGSLQLMDLDSVSFNKDLIDFQRAVPVVGAMDDMASDSEKSGGSLLTNWLEQANGLRFILHNCSVIYRVIRCVAVSQCTIGT